MSDPGLHSWARERFAAGWSGDFDGFAAARARLRVVGTPEATAWSLALSAQRWLAEPTAVALPDPSSLEPFVTGSASARAAAALAAVMGARAAWLRLDVDALEAHVQLLDRLEPPDDEAAMWRAVGQGWAQVLRGDTVALDGSVENAARASGHPALLLEIVALLALDRARRGDLDEATRLARRASRMARTEALPQLEYLANTVLARIRRLTGSPHLAARILRALLRVASEPWHAWMEWELALATGSTRASVPSECVHGLARGALEGREDELRRCYAEAMTHVGRTFLATDVEVLRALCDTADDVDRGLEAWRTGAVSALVPRGLHGIVGVHPDRAYREDPVWVFAQPDAPGRRVLVVAEGLARRMAPTVHMLVPSKKRRARTDAAVAALALRGGAPIDEVALFEQLYGFTYQASVHQGARDTLYHRVRERVGEVAALERSAGTVRLALDRPLLVPDPRCSPPPEHSLLSVLAEQGHASVRAAAAALGIPVRTAQYALRALAEEGVCRVEREGREFRYVLEDTTFSEPTRMTQFE